MSAYDDTFYKNRDARTRPSARRVVGLLRDAYPFRSAIDVGCGVGTWASVAGELGAAPIWGVEGDWLDARYVADPALKLHRHDLEQPLTLKRRFDLAISLEVAEHLTEARATGFVRDLCALAPVVLFSAAMKGQTGGVGHINMQWPSYWAQIFAGHGYRPLDMIRPHIWEERDIPLWYRQNTLVFVAPEAANLYARTTEGDPPLLDVVHPEMFDRYFARAT